MKKYLFMAVAAIAALSSCSSDNDFEQSQTGKQALVFTATMENSEATRATYDATNKCAAWEVGDQISINGKKYSAQEVGTTTTFEADNEGATGETYNAYFPADLYDGTTATLPAIQTYEAGEFNMPMYASSTTTTLEFKNLCAVLAVKVTSADIATLKSIKVASDKVMNGSFTVSDNKAVMGTDGSNVVVLESASALTLTEDGTIFYIAIPAQKYQYLNIFLSADGETYTQAMATKKAAGLGEIARSKIFNIDYAKNATKLWEGNLFIADCNVGATSPTDAGGYYTWGGSTSKNFNDQNTGTDALSGDTDTAYKLWGSNWRMMTKDELEQLLGFGLWNVNGLLCESADYADNTVFLPAAGYCQYGTAGGTNYGYYWSSTPNSSNSSQAYRLYFGSSSQRIDNYATRYLNHSVRAVLEEAETPTPPASATTGSTKATIGGEEVDVKWVQLWEDGPKFAEYNVGVTDGNAESFGGYFTWGGTYANGRGGIEWNGAYDMGYVDLSGDNDAATTIWGSNWRMPTKAEFEALLENCDKTVRTDSEGVTIGVKFTGKGAYESNSVYFPAGNSANEEGYFYTQGYHGMYWSSTHDTYTRDGFKYAFCLAFGEFDWRTHDYSQSVDSDFRGNAFSVRAVLK